MSPNDCVTTVSTMETENLWIALVATVGLLIWRVVRLFRTTKEGKHGT